MRVKRRCVASLEVAHNPTRAKGGAPMAETTDAGSWGPTVRLPMRPVRHWVLLGDAARGSKGPDAQRIKPSVTLDLLAVEVGLFTGRQIPLSRKVRSSSADDLLRSCRCLRQSRTAAKALWRRLARRGRFGIRRQPPYVACDWITFILALLMLQSPRRGRQAHAPEMCSVA